MNRTALISYIQKEYDVEPEYLWEKYPNYVVFRHSVGDKWFALIMDVAANKLQDGGDETVIDVIDLKVDPEVLGSLRRKKDISPAYHMNKEHWISVKLEGHVSDDELKSLIEESYQLTIK